MSPLLELKPVKNLRSAACFSNLVETIVSIANERRIIFSPARGNWGDGLINYGTRQLLDSNNVAYEECHKKDTLSALSRGDFSNSVVLIGGGGAWSRNFRLSREVTEQVAQQAHHVIVLPTTYDLPRLDGRFANITYFARDKQASISNIDTAIFCHDMAFYSDLSVPEIPEKIWRIFAMRDDREGLGYGHHFRHNIDLSQLGDADYKFVSPLFNLVNNFRVISTDRMHLAIVGAMLGLRVNLIPGNYSKSRDVFYSSIAPHYSHVRLQSIEQVVAWYAG